METNAIMLLNSTETPERMMMMIATKIVIVFFSFFFAIFLRSGAKFKRTRPNEKRPKEPNREKEWRTEKDGLVLKHLAESWLQDNV